MAHIYCAVWGHSSFITRCLSSLGDQDQGDKVYPRGSKAPKCVVYVVSVLGNVVTVSGIYSIFGYLDP